MIYSLFVTILVTNFVYFVAEQALCGWNDETTLLQGI
jgi:hypothetical protein